MAHPELLNHTPFACEALQTSDETARTVVVMIVKATFDIGAEATLAEEQAQVMLSGEYWGEPENTPYKLEPETAFFKPATDVVLVGHAYPPRAGATQVDIRFNVGPLSKSVRVFGDRFWQRAGASAAARFDVMPLSYDRAYGGWDRSNPQQPVCDRRNPLGRGFRRKGAKFQEGSQLPNLEDPAHLLTSYDGESIPAGVGFTHGDWAPRAALSGTYDDAWLQQRSPWLPSDFQRSFFNAASPGLIAPGYLRGDETVKAQGVRPDGATLLVRLPGISPPECTFKRRGSPLMATKTQFDTLIVDAERAQLQLLWRCCVGMPDGLQGLAAIELTCANAPQIKPKPVPARSNVLPFRAPGPANQLRAR